MSAYLAYSYIVNLTTEEQAEIDEKTKKSREEFSKGFVRGISFSLAIYSLYSLATSAAYAADSNVPSTIPKAPVDTPPTQPPTAPAKPGFKPINSKIKGTFSAGASAVCLAFFESGDFLVGVGCAVLVFIAANILNRP